MKVKVQSIESTTPNIKIFELVAVDGGALPSFQAGAHIDVHLPGNITRQYSLCQSTKDSGCYRIAVLHEQDSRGGSSFLHTQVSELDELEIGEPRNLFEMTSSQSEVVLLAGGIGITPLISMAEHCQESGIPFSLYYVVRDDSHIAFKDYLAHPKWKDKIHILCGRPSDEKLAQYIGTPHKGKHLYTCGPEGFMTTILERAQQNGWTSDHLHQEKFHAHLVNDEQSHRPFGVKIASSGEVIEIPTDRSITQVLEEKGYFIPVSCEEGVCGTCITNVLEGKVLHRDSFLTEDERASNKIMTPCCSRAMSDLLVLDL